MRVYLVAYFRITAKGQNPSRSFLPGPGRPDQIIDKYFVLHWEDVIRAEWNELDPTTKTQAIRIFNFQPL
jgi:hypothetical protein